MLTLKKYLVISALALTIVGQMNAMDGIGRPAWEKTDQHVTYSDPSIDTKCLKAIQDAKRYAKFRGTEPWPANQKDCVDLWRRMEKYTRLIDKAEAENIQEETDQQ